MLQSTRSRNGLEMLTLLPHAWHKILISQRFGKRVVVRDKNQGAVAKSPASKSIVDCHNSSIINLFPVLHCANCSFVGQSVTYTFEIAARSSSILSKHTFKSAECIQIAILCRYCFVNPTRISKSRSTFNVRCI